MTAPAIDPDFDYSSEEPTPGDLSHLTDLSRAQLQLAEDVREAEEALAKKKFELARIAEVEIPKLMATLGLQKFTLATGHTVAVKEELYTKVPKKHRTEAYLWVEANGGEQLPKRAFEITFSKDDEAWAKKFERDCLQRKKPLNIQRDMTVAPATLKVFLRQKLEAGDEVPMALFGAFQKRVAVISSK